jgi:hypothetical protein
MTGTGYYTINKFMNKFLELFPLAPQTESPIKTLQVLFRPKDAKANRWHHLNIWVYGVICGKSAYAYPTLRSRFGPKIIISLKPDDCQKVSKSKEYLLISIDIAETKFINKEKTEITYHKYTISDSKNKAINTLIASYNESNQPQDIDLEDDIEII